MINVCTVRRNGEVLGQFPVKHDTPRIDDILQRAELRDLNAMNNGQGPDEMQVRYRARLLREELGQRDDR